MDVRLRNYDLENVQLGKGAFGRVVLGKHFLIHRKVALKLIDLRKLKGDSYALVNLEREAMVMFHLKHENIIRLVEICRTPEFYCIVLEYIPGSLNLYKAIKNNGVLTQEKALPLVRQMFSALAYMHSKMIIHRDIKLENILVNLDLTRCYFIDFGLSNFWKSGKRMKTLCGSLEYFAPEIISMKKYYGPKVDVWSLGVVLHGMLLGDLPFLFSDDSSIDYDDRVRVLKKKIRSGLTADHHLEMKNNLSVSCCKLIARCLEVSPRRRIAASEAGLFGWIKGPDRFSLNLAEAEFSPEVLNSAALKLKTRLNLKHTLKDILSHVERRPFSTTGGCINLLSMQIEEMRKANVLLSGGPAPTRSSLKISWRKTFRGTWFTTEEVGGQRICTLTVFPTQPEPKQGYLDFLFRWFRN